MIDLTPDPSKPIMEFPAIVPVSAIGLRVDGFAQAVAACVAQVVADFDPHTIAMQPSSGGKYLSVRFSARVTSQAHLHELDAVLRAHPQVIRVI